MDAGLDSCFLRVNIMKTFLFVSLVVCCGGFAEVAQAFSGLPRRSPESQGMSSKAILAFVEAADQELDSLHSVMVVRHGKVVAEGWWAPYSAESPHELYSLSKSFTSTAVGLAIGEGKLSLDDEVLKFFPDEAPEKPSNNLKSMRVRDLLRMSTGQQSEPPRDGENWAETFLSHPVPFKPGTHFLYNTSATYMLSAIVQKATGETVLDYLTPRLFEPLGIEKPTWGTSPQGVSLGGYGLNVRTEDIARFGQLYLQKGMWEGKPVVPGAWVTAATSLQTSNGSNPRSDWDQGYGYQFWRCRHGAYRGDGAFGQFCIVMPEQDAVIAITSGLKDMQAVLNLVWDHLLPAMGDSALPEDEGTAAKLKERLESLTLKVPEGQVSNATGERISLRRITFPENERKIESIQLGHDSRTDANVLIMEVDGEKQTIVCGHNEWTKGKLALGGFPERPAAACGAWTGDNTFSARICFYETPFVVDLTLKVDGDEVILESSMNVGFGPTRQKPVTGRFR